LSAQRVVDLRHGFHRPLYLRVYVLARCILPCPAGRFSLILGMILDAAGKLHFVISRKDRSMNATLIMPAKFLAVFS
jgi:hypothetical protein